MKLAEHTYRAALFDNCSTYSAPRPKLAHAYKLAPTKGRPARKVPSPFPREA